jgi:hypothetical protein
MKSISIHSLNSSYPYFSKYLLLGLLVLIFSKCNNKYPFYAPYKNVKGYVIAKETCNTDSTKDYWLIDLTYLPNTPQYGDTLILNNVTYTNVVKTLDLSEQLKHIGTRVSIDFSSISPDRAITYGCNNPNPVTYPLKELYIIYQFEIR